MRTAMPRFEYGVWFEALEKAGRTPYEIAASIAGWVEYQYKHPVAHPDDLPAREFWTPDRVEAFQRLRER